MAAPGVLSHRPPAQGCRPDDSSRHPLGARTRVGHRSQGRHSKRARPRELHRLRRQGAAGHRGLQRRGCACFDWTHLRYQRKHARQAERRQRPQAIVAFSAEDAPASIGLIFDTSGSMRDKLNVAKAALRAFVDNANSADEAFLSDHRGATVNGLDRANFTVFEDKAPQAIVAFSAEDAPASIGLIFDTSGSMRDKLNVAKAALRAFVDNANSADEAFLFTVSTRPDISSAFTSDLGSLAESAHLLSAGGDTALIDTIYAGLERMRSASNPRRALLILSDGMDNHSRKSKGELMRLAMEADVQIYAIRID